MEEKVIFRKPFDKRNNIYLKGRLDKIKSMLDDVTITENLFIGLIKMRIVNFELEKLAKDYGFESYADMTDFRKNFGISALLDVKYFEEGQE